jgi:hypothetical protein
MRTPSFVCIALAAAYAAATPVSALYLNSFRAQHGRPALGVSGQLAGGA